ncbi:hypothetical protein [Actinokineospora sp.]|uniref:hypothetical protein n=1 Tax=Actinokineospora sp. TaxID=1872133 RepID=UPI00403793C8
MREQFDQAYFADRLQGVERVGITADQQPPPPMPMPAPPTPAPAPWEPIPVPGSGFAPGGPIPVPGGPGVPPPGWAPGGSVPAPGAGPVPGGPIPVPESGFPSGEPIPVPLPVPPPAPAPRPTPAPTPPVAGGPGAIPPATSQPEPDPDLPRPFAGPVTLPATATPAKDHATPGYWDVDLDKLSGFGLSVSSARFGLAAVQARVERMQGEEYIPKLGTSPAGQQLAKKFDDRLNGDDGLRGLLTEAMRRMDQFIESAERVRDTYRETEATAQDSIKRTDETQGG